jgi:DNA-binding FrmR family transcriptional regulator
MSFFIALDKYPIWVYNGVAPKEGEIFMAADEEKKKQSCSCSFEIHKTKHRTPEEVRKLSNRLSRIEGQIRGIRSMVEKNAYCPEILVQCSAVTAAMNAFNRELLASHIRTCVAEGIREGKDDVIDELVFTLQKLMK